MGKTRGRLLVAALALTALAPVGSAQAAAPEAPAAAEPSEYRQAKIVAGKKNLLGMNLKPTATLTDAVTGAPLVGFPVLFYLRDNPVGIPHMCGGYTNAKGVAKCGNLRIQSYVLQRNGYLASFQSQEVGGVFWFGGSDEVSLFGS